MKRGEKGGKREERGGTKTLDKKTAKTRASRYLRCHNKGLSLRVQGRLKLPFPRSRPPIAVFGDPIRRPNPELRALGYGCNLARLAVYKDTMPAPELPALLYYMYDYGCYFLGTEQ